MLQQTRVDASFIAAEVASEPPPQSADDGREQARAGSVPWSWRFLTRIIQWLSTFKDDLPHLTRSEGA